MKLLTLLFLVLLTSCTQLSSVSQTSIPAKKGDVVTATVENGIVFMMNFSNSYLDEINSKLAAQCPNGSIEGVLTKHETKTYFPLIYSKIIVTAQGYCND